ncbi:MAG: Uma2 family endonuclease [Tepidiformaceae bacterium]
MATVAKRMTLAEFLELPETEPPSEFICGEVVQKPMPSFAHGLSANTIGALLFIFLRRTKEGVVVVETRHADEDEQRAYLPDVAVVLAANTPKTAAGRYREPRGVSPDIAIEILSPDARPGRVAEKLAF